MISTSQRKSWDDSYEELVAFHKSHGHCNVPQHDQKYAKLMKLVQKQKYRHPSPFALHVWPLRQDQIDRLKALGFIWSDGTGKQWTWNESFEQLKWYKLEHGDCLVPKSYKDDPSLGIWVQSQRSIFKSSIMDLCQVEQLNSIGFFWKSLIGKAARKGDTGVKHVGTGNRKRKAQEPPCYENTSKVPQHSSASTISEHNLLERSSTQKPPAHTEKKTESAKSHPTKARAPKATHNSRKDESSKIHPTNWLAVPFAKRASDKESELHVLRMKAEEVLLFSEAHSLGMHPDFQPLVFPYPFQSTMSSVMMPVHDHVPNPEHLQGMAFPSHYSALQSDGQERHLPERSEESKVSLVCGSTVEMMQSEGVYSTLVMDTGRISDDAKQATENNSI